MKRIAMIQDGVVSNIAIWDGVTEWSPEGFLLIDITNSPEVSIGCIYSEDGSWSLPTEA